jgi:hypothetical protein
MILIGIVFASFNFLEEMAIEAGGRPCFLMFIDFVFLTFRIHIDQMTIN